MSKKDISEMTNDEKFTEIINCLHGVGVNTGLYPVSFCGSFFLDGPKEYSFLNNEEKYKTMNSNDVLRPITSSILYQMHHSTVRSNLIKHYDFFLSELKSFSRINGETYERICFSRDNL